MGDKRNGSRAQVPTAWRLRWAQRENQRRLAEYTTVHQRWQADLDDLDQMLGAARTFEGLPVDVDSPLALKRGERVFLALPMATLIEDASVGRHLPMNERFSWRGTRAPVGPATVPAGMRAVDIGPVTLTDRRVVLHGRKHAREWAFSKLLGLENGANGPCTVFQVSNRQKPSGVLYPPSAVPSWRFHVALALADFADQRQALVTSLERERQELVALRPAVPAAALPEQAPPHLALVYAVRTLYLGCPGQGTGRRIVQGTVASVVTLLALSIVASLSSPTVSTTSAGVAVSATSSSSGSALPGPSDNQASGSPVGTSTTSTVASVRPQVKVPAQRQPVTAAPKPPSAPTTRTTPRPTPTPKPRPTPKLKPTPKPTPAAPKLCGAPSNPWGYTFCGGGYITSPPSSFCAYFDCIKNFPNGKGYVEQCVDGMFSKSGGRQGACSHHGGERRPLFR